MSETMKEKAANLANELGVGWVAVEFGDHVYGAMHEKAAISVRITSSLTHPYHARIDKHHAVGATAQQALQDAKTQALRAMLQVKRRMAMACDNQPQDPESALGHLQVVGNFLSRVKHWEEGKPDRREALVAMDAAVDAVDWVEKGLEEWRSVATTAQKQAAAAQATARIAIGHLQAVLNTARTHHEQQVADTAARDWLISIGSEPS